MPPKKQKQGEVAQLVSALRNVSIRPTPKKRRRPRQRRQNMNETLGRIVLHRKELVTTIQLSSNASSADGSFDIAPAAFPFLKGLGAVFEQSRWDMLKLFYKPAVGTTFGGLVSVGVDWDSTGSQSSRSSVVALTPNFTTPAWCDTEKNPLTCKVNQLQARLWFAHNTKVDMIKGPGKIFWAVDATSAATKTTVGEIWVEYRITLQGTHAS